MPKQPGRRHSALCTKWRSAVVTAINTKPLRTVLNFAGMREVSEAKAEVIVKTDQEQLAELRAIAQRLGVPENHFVGQLTEAEWQEINTH